MYRWQRYPDAALSSDRIVGRIDGGDLFSRESHRFRGNTTRDYLVGVIVGDELPVVNFERIVADLGRDTQDLIRITLGRTHVARLDVAELSIGESEALRHRSEKLLLVGMKHSICLGDVEETFKHIL